MIAGELRQAIPPSRSSLFVSHSRAFSLFFPPILLYLSLSLSLLEYGVPRSRNSSELAATCVGHTDSDSGKMVYSSSVAVQTPMFGWWVARGEDRHIPMIDWPSLAVLTTIKGWFMISILSSLQWYPLFTMKVFRSLTRFFVQNDKIFPVDPSQTELYFEVTISNLYSWRKITSNII